MEKPKRRKPSEIAADYDTKIRDIRPGETQEQYYRALAKAADTRLARLEQLQEKANYRGVLSYAYQNAMYDIREMRGDPNARRFNVAVKKNKDGTVNKTDLHRKINAVKRFLESPTSMKSKIDVIYKRRAEKLNEKFGTNFDWKDLGRFFESKAYATQMAKYKGASDKILKSVGSIEKKYGRKDIEKGIDQNVKISDDEVIDEMAKDMIASGLSAKDFYK